MKVMSRKSTRMGHERYGFLCPRAHLLIVFPIDKYDNSMTLCLYWMEYVNSTLERPDA